MSCQSALGLLLAGLVLGVASAPAAALDRDAALARAREIRDRVSRGDTAPLWSEFDDGMRAALKDSVSFAGMSAGIHAQLGAIDSVLDEQVSEHDSMLVVRSRCRFAKLPVPAVLMVGFTPDGRIGMLAVRPDAPSPTEYPSKFLDYQPKTRFELPFQGEWWVAWGGRTLAENHHANIRAQRFAHDLCRMKDGRTHTGDGKALTDYHCYGQPLLAPAAGVVVTALDSLPDQAIGASDRSRPAGNHVVIDHGHGEYSLLAHLQPGSLKVRVGQSAKAGAVLGRVGNSGNTSEPHLHVHLMNGPRMEDSEGLPMPFSDYLLDGKPVVRGELLRFQLVSRRKP